MRRFPFLLPAAAALVAPLLAGPNAAHAQDGERRGTFEYTIRVHGSGSGEVGSGTVERTLRARMAVRGLESPSNLLDEEGTGAPGGAPAASDILAMAISQCGGNRDCERAIREQLARAGLQDTGRSGGGAPLELDRYIVWEPEDGCAGADVSIADEATARYADEGGGAAREYRYRAHGQGSIAGVASGTCVQAMVVHDTKTNRYWLRLGANAAADITESSTRDGQPFGTNGRRSASVLDGQNRTFDDFIELPNMSGPTGTHTLQGVLTRTFDAQRVRDMRVDATITWTLAETRR